MLPVVRGVGCRDGRDGLVQLRIERRAIASDALDAEAVELGEELLRGPSRRPAAADRRRPCRTSCAASIARSRLSTTSSRLTSTSRRLRSASFASSLRMRARASSNSCDAWRYFAEVLLRLLLGVCATLAVPAPRRRSASATAGRRADRRASSPRAHQRRSTTLTGIVVFVSHSDLVIAGRIHEIAKVERQLVAFVARS